MSPRTKRSFDLEACQRELSRMLKNSQTKIIMPVIAHGLLRAHVGTRETVFTDSQIKRLYRESLEEIARFLGHRMHLGAKYYDAYGGRMARYDILQPLGHLKYRLRAPYATRAAELSAWLMEAIKDHIEQRLGIVLSLGKPVERARIAEDPEGFLRLLDGQISKNPASFEIFSFAIIKVHLEKFACKIYRDTRTSAHDCGVDLSTNFGVVYQVKKLSLATIHEADRICSEIKRNFDAERIEGGHVVLVIDDISREIKRYLVNMKIQSLSKPELLRLAYGFEDAEDRQKVLRVVYEEFAREYSGE